MRPNPQEIVALYERHETAAGGYARADIPAIIRQIAEETGLSTTDVRDILIEVWTASAG